MTVTTQNLSENDGEVVQSESIISTMGPGDAFGEIALIDQLPHSATVRTISDSTIYLLSSNYLNSIAEKEPRIGFVIYRNMAKLICHRLRLTNFSSKHFWLGAEKIDGQSES